MLVIYIALEYVSYLCYQRTIGTPTEALLHIIVSCTLFGVIALATVSRPRLGFVLSVIVLLLSCVAYFVSYQTERALGVPLRLSESLENLRKDDALIGYLIDFLSRLRIEFGFGLVGIAVAIFILSRTSKRFSGLPKQPTIFVTLISVVTFFGYGMLNPRAIRFDTRLVFYFSWPKSVVPRGMERHMDSIDARDMQARAIYNAVPARTPTIVLLLSDSLRADHFPEYGYSRDTAPFLSELSKTGRLQKVEWAFSSCSDSFCGITTTLGSRTRNDVSEHFLKFHELLAKGGYETWALLAGDHRKFDDLGVFYGDSFDHFFDIGAYPNLEKNDDAIILESLKEIPPADKTPRFFYFFLMSSHVLGHKPPETQIYNPSDIREFVTQWHSTDFNTQISKLGLSKSAASERLRNNYDNGIRAADQVIRQIFERLTKLGYLDDALVFMLGDHGDGLGEHNHLGHTYFLYNEDIRIPFFIYDTSGMKLRNTFYATQEDIAPTILERVGLPIPEFYSGHSLYSQERKFSFHQSEHRNSPCYATIRSVEQKLFKLMECNVPHRKRDEMFEVTEDPEELHSRSMDAPSDTVKLMRDQLTSLKQIP